AAAQLHLQLATHRIIVPAGKVGGRIDGSTFQVDDAGDAHADAEPAMTVGIRGQQLSDGAGHFMDDVLASLAEGCRFADGFQQPSRVVDNSDAQIRPAEIYADGKRRHCSTPRSAISLRERLSLASRMQAGEIIQNRFNKTREYVRLFLTT